MTSHSRGLHHVPRNKALGLALALAIGTSVCVDAQAARAGHARVASMPGEPMRIEIPLLDLTADEVASLQVQLADAASWQRAGLQPPAPLADTRVSLEGSGAARRVVSITATQPITTQTVDVLLDLRSSAGQRQMQVTLMVPARDAEAGLRRAAVPAASAPAPQSSVSSGSQPVQRVDDVTVRPGQTLSGIAARHAVADASVYQMLVALWQANPQAFIQNNMNLVRAGETLSIPDAATVRAIDPAEARRIFVEQAAAYERYRGRLGAAAGAGTAVPRADGSSGQVDSAAGGSASVQPPAQDRLRLSNAAAGAAAGSPGGASASPDAAGDARASDQRAMNEARQRVDALQSNVDALNRAAAGQAAGAGGATSGPGGAAGQGNAAQPAGGGASDTGAASGSTAGAAASGAGSANGNATRAASGSAVGGAAGAATAGAGGATNNGAAAGAPGNGLASGANGASASVPAGQSGTAAQAGAAGAAAGTPSAAVGPAGNAAPSPQCATAQTKSDMPSWLADNLLAVVTAVLALLIFIVAWMLRRAGARRNEDVEAVDYSDPPPFDSRAFNRKLDAIDLDLNHPPSDDTKPVQRDASPAAPTAPMASASAAPPTSPASTPSPFASSPNPPVADEAKPAQGSAAPASSSSPSPSPFASPSSGNRN